MSFDSDNPLQAEIQQEMAAAYFAACRKMVDSLEALKAFDRALASTPPDTKQIQCRSELLEEAAERVYFVVIQREAMKFSLREEFFKAYEIPDEVIGRVGSKRLK